VEGAKAILDITANEGVNVNTDVEDVATNTVVNTIVDFECNNVQYMYIIAAWSHCCFAI
jgi:hypothetical protein